MSEYLQGARSTRIFDHECHVAQEHGPQNIDLRFRRPGGAIDPVEPSIGDPFHDRLPNRVLGREVTEQGTLRNAHVLCDRGRRDLVRVLLPGQSYDNVTGLGAPLIGGHRRARVASDLLCIRRLIDLFDRLGWPAIWCRYRSRIGIAIVLPSLLKSSLHLLIPDKTQLPYSAGRSAARRPAAALDGQGCSARSLHACG